MFCCEAPECLVVGVGEVIGYSKFTNITCVCVCVAQGRSSTDPWLSGPTILCAGSQQIYDILVLPDDLHHLHLWDKVWQVFLCGVSCRGRELNHIRVIRQCSVHVKAQQCLTIITLHTNIAAVVGTGWRLFWRMLLRERHLKYQKIHTIFPPSSLFVQFNEHCFIWGVKSSHKSSFCCSICTYI